MDKSVHDLCRLCGEDRKCSFSVFVKTEDEIALRDVIKNNLYITILEDDTIPTEICSKCHAYLLGFIKFREVAQKTQLFLYDVEAKLVKENEATQAVETIQILAETDTLSTLKSEESENVECMMILDPSDQNFTSDDDNIPLNKVAEADLAIKKTKVRKRLRKIKKDSTCAEVTTKKDKKQKPSNAAKQSAEYTIEYPLENPEECSICQKRFTKERYLRLHLRLTHNIIIAAKYPCHRCTRKFMQKESFEKHLKLHDDPNFNKPIPCNVCGKIYSNKQTLKVHVRSIHMDDGERKFVCEECGALFKAISSLKAHQISHTGEFPYECSTCERRFQTKTNLYIHMDIHSPTPYVCNICHSQLTTLRGLRLHMIKHSDRKPHQCPVCGNSYKRVTALKKHLIVHSGIKPYACNFCERTFADGSNKRIHMKRVHKKELAEMEASGYRFTPTVLPKLQELKKDGIAAH